MTPIDFETEVLTRSHSIPVLVDFWAPWCAPCRALTPILEQAAERHADRFALVKVNTEEQPEIAERYRVRGIPNVKLFVDGQVVNEFTGALSATMLEEWLQRALPSPFRTQLLEAEQLVAEGRNSEATALLEEILATEPRNDAAAVLLARLWLPTDPAKAAAAVERVGPDSDLFGEAEALRTFVRLFGLIGDPGRLPEHVAKEDYLAAARHLRQGDYDAALAGFIRVVRNARSYDEDGARKACVAIFKHLGDDHELTRKYRSLLSSALYV
jgi:putative thioredoxin